MQAVRLWACYVTSLNLLPHSTNECRSTCLITLCVVKTQWAIYTKLCMTLYACLTQDRNSADISLPLISLLLKLSPQPLALQSKSKIVNYFLLPPKASNAVACHFFFAHWKRRHLSSAVFSFPAVQISLQATDFLFCDWVGVFISHSWKWSRDDLLWGFIKTAEFWLFWPKSLL